jgi:hypothetical protein
MLHFILDYFDFFAENVRLYWRIDFNHSILRTNTSSGNMGRSKAKVHREEPRYRGSDAGRTEHRSSCWNFHNDRYIFFKETFQQEIRLQKSSVISYFKTILLQFKFS